MTSGTTTSGFGRILERLLGWLPAWLGLALIVLAGLAAIVFGAITPDAGLIAFGVAALASAAIGYWSGARSQPRVNPFERSFGGFAALVDDVIWLVILALFVVAIIIALLT